MSETVVVFSGGSSLSDWHRAVLVDDATVIGVDSGVDRAHEVGVTVDIAVGDFDSVTARGLAEAERSGATILRHPSVKDRTDLELAIDVAIDCQPKRIMFVAMSGGRSDHEFAGLMLLADPRLKRFDVDVLLADARIAVVQDRRTLTGRVDDVVSLVPAGGSCFGVTTSGLRYRLDDDTMHVSTGRGVSNVLVAPVAVVSVRTGTLFAFQPRSSDGSRS
jgi:thiamine pyrophosphokinase